MYCTALYFNVCCVLVLSFIVLYLLYWVLLYCLNCICIYLHCFCFVFNCIVRLFCVRLCCMVYYCNFNIHLTQVQVIQLNCGGLQKGKNFYRQKTFLSVLGFRGILINKEDSFELSKILLQFKNCSFSFRIHYKTKMYGDDGSWTMNIFLYFIKHFSVILDLKSLL